MKKTILLIDDNKRLRDSLKDHIEFDGIFNVIAVEDGYAAYEWLKNNPEPALVLTDFNMPCRGDIIAKSVTRLNIPILMITNSPDKAKEALLESGIRIPVVSKTICIHQILILIDKLTNTSIKKKQPA